MTTQAGNWKKKAAFLIAIALFLLLQSTHAFAAAAANPTFYFPMDENQDLTSTIDSVVGLNMSGEQLTAFTGKIVENSFNWTGELVETQTFFDINTSMSFAICLRFLTDRQVADQYFFEINNDTDDTLINFHYKSTGLINWAYRDDLNVIKSVTTAVAYPADGTPHLVCAQRESSQLAMQLWVDGVLRVNSTADYGAGALRLANANWGVGENPGAGNDFYGLMDEFYFYSRALSHEEMVNFNSTTPASTPDGGLTITAVNSFDDASLLDFNVTISNSTDTLTVESNFTTGEAFFVNVSDGNYTVNVSNSQFFNLSYTIELLNVNATVQSNLSQAYVLVEAYRALTGIRVNNSNVTLGSQSNSTANGTSYLLAAGGTHTLSWSAAGYWPEAYSVTYSNLSYNYFRFNVTQLKMNVTATQLGGAAINNFTVNITRTTGDFTQSDLNSTTSGVSAFAIEAGQYNISIVADGYAFADQLITFNSTPTFFQVNFTLLASNAFNFTFRDEVTKALIDYATVSLDLISDSLSGSYNTTNGTLEVSLLVPETYTIRYRAPDYPERFYYFNLSNGTYNQLTLYLLNGTQAENVTVSVVDENAEPVEGALVTSLRFDPDSNSYIIQEIAQTNFAGEAIMRIQMFTEYYKFLVTYDGELKKVTTPFYVTESPLQFQIFLQEVSGQQYFDYLDISYDLYFNNATQNFVYTFSDPNGLTSRGCLYIYAELGVSSTLHNSTCSNGAAGSIVLGIDPVNGTTYVAKAYVTLNSQEEYLDEEVAYFGRSDDFNSPDMLIFMILLTLILVFAVPGIVLKVAIAPTATVFFSVLQLTPIEPWAALGMQVVFLIIAFGVIGGKA